MTFIFRDLTGTFSGIIAAEEHNLTHLGNGVICFKADDSPAVFYRSGSDSISWDGVQYGGDVTSGYRQGYLDGSTAYLWKIVNGVGNNRILRLQSSSIALPNGPTWGSNADDLAGLFDKNGEIEDGASVDFANATRCFGRKTIGTDEVFQWVYDNVQVDTPVDLALIDVIADETTYPTIGLPKVVRGDGTHYHVFFTSSSGPSRTTTTLWHALVSGTQESLSVDINPVHDQDETIISGDVSNPIKSDDGNIHVVMTIKVSGTDRLYYGLWDKTTETWSTEEVSSTWSAFITPAHSVSVDRSGLVYIMAIGEDPDTANVSRMHIYFGSTGSWTHEEIPDILFTGAGGSSIAISNGSGNLYPVTGTFFLVWNATLNDWYGIYSDGLTFGLDERKPECEAEPDRSSIVFADEGTSQETLALKPDLVFSEDHTWPGMRVPTERGYVVTWPEVEEKRRRWRCRFINRTEADKDTLITLFDDRSGPEEAWSLTIPPAHTETVKVAIQQDSIDEIFVQPNVYTIEIQVVELLT